MIRLQMTMGTSMNPVIAQFIQLNTQFFSKSKQIFIKCLEIDATKGLAVKAMAKAEGNNKYEKMEKVEKVH